MTCVALLCFLELHRAGGAQVYVNVNEIMVIDGGAKGFAPPGTGAVMKVHDTAVYVRETPRQVIEMLVRAGR